MILQQQKAEDKGDNTSYPNRLTEKVFTSRQKTYNLTPEQTKRRLNWLSKLRVGFEGQIDSFKTYNQEGKILYSDPIQTMELYEYINEEGKKEYFNTPLEFKQYDEESFWDNTRPKLPSETVFEIDKLEPTTAQGVIIEVSQALIRNNIHFAIFYAEGQRSPHIRIYDFLNLAEVKGYAHQEAQKEFWKSISPQLWVYADQRVWSEEHTLQLEFSIHYKYETLFDLLYEHLPTPTKEKQEVLFS